MFTENNSMVCHYGEHTPATDEQSLLFGRLFSIEFGITLDNGMQSIFTVTCKQKMRPTTKTNHTAPGLCTSNLFIGNILMFINIDLDIVWGALVHGHFFAAAICSNTVAYVCALSIFYFLDSILCFYDINSSSSSEVYKCSQWQYYSCVSDGNRILDRLFLNFEMDLFSILLEIRISLTVVTYNPSQITVTKRKTRRHIKCTIQWTIEKIQ